MSKVCCVCLNLGTDFNALTKKDSNKITLLTKFEKCIWEVHWVPSFQVCPCCTEKLDFVYAFREACLQSDLIRKDRDCLPNLQHQEEVCKKECNEAVFLEKNKVPCDNLVPDTKGFLKDDPHTSRTSNADLESPYSSSNEIGNEAVKADLQPQISKAFINKSTIRETGDIGARKKRKREFICEKCDQHFLSSTKLTIHCKKDHGMQGKDVKPFSCDRCPQRFSTSSNLWQHSKYHDGIKSNMCTYCGKGFITKTDLITHEKKHLNRREYICEICNKSFNTHKDLRSHKLIVHTAASNWKYTCEICTKPFPIKSNYDSHMRRHTGDKKFSCHLCDKKFIAKCDLQRHLRSHSDVREYQCPHCDNEYKDERVLKVHLAKAHGIGLGKVKIPVRAKNYVCHFCSKAYYAKNKLTRHLYTHSGEKPFGCPICSKTFNDKSYVKQHLRNSHNVNHMDVLDGQAPKEECVELTHSKPGFAVVS